jgi:hypothetical protein
MAARSEKIPIIFYMHGANMGEIENAIWDETDRLYADYMLVYGKGEENYINSRPSYPDIHVHPVTVGSSRFDSIQKQKIQSLRQLIRKKIKIDENENLILYVPTMLINYYRDDISYSGNHRIFEIRKKFADLIYMCNTSQKIIYKAFLSKGYDPTISMLEIICGNKMYITTHSLHELQWAADLLIYEVPSSGFFEGLLTNKPIIVFIDKENFFMPKNVLEQLKKRAIVAETPDDFLKEINAFLTKGDYSPLTNPNREFLSHFFTYTDDGNSAKRATDAIIKILGNTRSKTA